MKTFSVLFLCAAVHTLSAQNIKQGLVVGSGGAGKTTSNTTLSWTIGQPVIKTFSNGDVTLSSGNQQTDVKLLITAVEDQSATTLTIQAYPNPAQDQLLLTFNEPLKTPSGYDLITADGRCVASGTVLANNQPIDVSALTTGMYLLTVHINNTIQSFKIIKQ